MLSSANDVQNAKLDWVEDCHRECTAGSESGKRFLRLVGPQLAVVLLLLLYLIIGAICFRQLDPQLAEVAFTELLLFCFETLATIGYGNICPMSTTARLFTMVYSLLGTPLCMLVLANLGKHLTKAYALFVRSLRHKRLTRPISTTRLPLFVLLLLFLLCIFFSNLLIGHSPSFSSAMALHLDYLYYSIVSFSTVGFGDIFPTTDGGTFLRLISLLGHLSLGMIVMGIWFQLARDWMQRLFRFKQRRFKHARDKQVWFGRKQMRLSTVLEVVTKEFKASPAQIHQVMNDLDFLISDALDPMKKKLPY